jgi:Protein kinase domain
MVAPSMPGQGMCSRSSSTSTTCPADGNDAFHLKRCMEECRCGGYGRVCPCSAMLAGEAAIRAVAKLREDSQLFQNNSQCDSLRKVLLDDIVMGESLGEGGFCVVKACWVQGEQLAIKYLKRPVMVTRKQFLHGAADLAQEAYFLHALNHKHIIQLHSVADGSLKDNIASGRDCGFFITVDRLYDTLEHRLEKWRQQHEDAKHSHGLFASFRSPSSSAEAKDHKRELFQQKLQFALDIASALHYLHQNNVIFRDLKVSWGMDEIRRY